MSKKHVFVGLSGGVDSAVSAALLLQEGYQVTAVFMKNWSGVTAGVQCPWEDDYRASQAVAAHLGVGLKLYDFEKLYRKTVGKYLIDAYAAGLTPNPDIMCNEEIKFKAFAKKCLSEGADYIATGHYARIEDGKLKRGKDSSKDQSYFLYRIDKDILNKVCFPIGEHTKKAVRVLASELGLPNAKRADSMGICFVGPVPMKDFLHEFIEYKAGKIFDDTGAYIGDHDGVFFYTIGQRHGLGIGGGEPYFVYDKDITKNILYVTTNSHSSVLNKKQLVIADCVWFEELKNKTYSVQIRYRSPASSAKVKQISGKNFEVTFENAVKAITPGQSAVIYDDDTVVGGGIIT